MTKKQSKRLVIDASVARASGSNTETDDLTGIHCRDFLQAVFDTCHQVVMTPDIKAEWDKHQSMTARQWLRMMVTKKKMCYIKTVAANQELWDTMDRLARGSKQREEMFKDIRLIEAAIAADRRIVSLDERARRPYNLAAKQVDELKIIIWVNPDKPEEKAIAWLSAGAPEERDRRLGAC